MQIKFQIINWKYEKQIGYKFFLNSFRKLVLLFIYFNSTSFLTTKLIFNFNYDNRNWLKILDESKRIQGRNESFKYQYHKNCHKINVEIHRVANQFERSYI